MLMSPSTIANGIAETAVGANESLVRHPFMHVLEHPRCRLLIGADAIREMKVGIIAKIDDIPAAAENEFVARVEFHLAEEAMAVDIGAVARTEVGGERLVAAGADEAMMPAHLRVVNAEIAIVAPADQKFVPREGNFANSAIGRADFQEFLLHDAPLGEELCPHDTHRGGLPANTIRDSPHVGDAFFKADRVSILRIRRAKPQHDDPTEYWRQAVSTPTALALAAAFTVACALLLPVRARHGGYGCETLLRWLCD